MGVLVWVCSGIPSFGRVTEYKIYRLNLGRPREIPNSSGGVKVHRTVRMRMEASHEHSGQKYKPKAHFENPIWIDDDVPLQVGQRS